MCVCVRVRVCVCARVYSPCPMAVLRRLALTSDLRSRLATGVLTGAYEATRFKEKPSLSPLERVEVLGLGEPASNAFLAEAAAFASGTTVARCAARPPRTALRSDRRADQAIDTINRRAS